MSKCFQSAPTVCHSAITRRRHRRLALSVSATAWDPEGLFKSAPTPGLIDRKLMQSRVGEDQDTKAAMEQVFQAQKLEVTKRRESRTPPTDPHDLVEYFLDTEATDMDYEVARCRPSLDKDFFATVDRLVGVERFSPAPDEDRLAELETLRDFLKEAVEAVDNAATAVAAAPERMRKLLVAKDKKAMLLEMAGAGEIDQPLIDLLQQNIDGAKNGGQKEAAEFMTKVQQAAMRYLIKAA
jgi:hypothetical protein